MYQRFIYFFLLHATRVARQRLIEIKKQEESLRTICKIYLLYFLFVRF